MDPLARELYDILACPKCKADVKYNAKKTGLMCSTCKEEYPIKKGIPVMMV